MSELPSYTCRRAPSKITIDGVMDDAAWSGAEPISLVLTDSGFAPKQPTAAKMLWDDDYLYVGFHSIDDDIRATLTRRDDDLWTEEVVEIFIDADGDERTYAEIEVSPINNIVDLYILNRGRVRMLREWDCEGMITAVTVDGVVNGGAGTSRSWTCEMAIPHVELPTAPNIPPKVGDVWRANLYRIDRADDGDEYLAWSPTGRVDYHTPSRFGWILFAE